MNHNDLFAKKWEEVYGSSFEKYSEVMASEVMDAKGTFSTKLFDKICDYKSKIEYIETLIKELM